MSRLALIVVLFLSLSITVVVAAQTCLDSSTPISDSFPVDGQLDSPTWLVTNPFQVESPSLAWISGGWVTGGSPAGSNASYTGNTFYFQPRSGPVSGTLVEMDATIKFTSAANGQTGKGTAVLMAAQPMFRPGFSNFIHMNITQSWMVLTWWMGSVYDKQFARCAVSGGDTISGTSVFYYAAPVPRDTPFSVALQHVPGTDTVLGVLPDGNTFVCHDPHADQAWGNLPVWEEYYDGTNLTYPLYKAVSATAFTPCP